MEQKILSAEPCRTFSNEFKLQMVKLASQPGASVARIAREHDINDNLLFKWLRLWQNEGRLSHHHTFHGFTYLDSVMQRNSSSLKNDQKYWC